MKALLFCLSLVLASTCSTGTESKPEKSASTQPAREAVAKEPVEAAKRSGLRQSEGPASDTGIIAPEQDRAVTPAEVQEMPRHRSPEQGDVDSIKAAKAAKKFNE